MQCGCSVNSGQRDHSVRDALLGRALPGTRQEQLALEEPLICALPSHELLVRSALHQPTVLDDQQLVRLDDGRETVRDDDDGLVPVQARERILDVGLGLRVQRAGGFVEDQDRRVLEEHAREGDALLLAPGEPHASLAEHGLESLREVVDEPGVRAFEGVRICSSDGSKPSP